MATTVLLHPQHLTAPPPVQYATRPISRQSSHSAGSAASSTLIVTPVSSKLRERYGVDLPPSPPTLSQLTPAYLSQQWVPASNAGQLPRQESGTNSNMAGYTQPHVSNVPRRRKILLPPPREDAAIQRISAPPSPHTPKSPHFELRPAAMIEVDEPRDLAAAAPLPIALPSLPMLVQIPTVPAIDFPGYALSGPVDIVVDIDPPSVPSVDLHSTSNGVRRSSPARPSSGPPSIATAANLINLPRRRRHPLTGEEVERERRKSWERNHHLLEFGHRSGVFVALADEDELEQQRIPDLGLGLGGAGRASTSVVRLLRGRIDEGREVGKWMERSSGDSVGDSMNSSTELDLFLEDEDSDRGITSLSFEQLGRASSFCSNSRTILVIAPRSSPTDAISLAAYLLVTRFQSQSASATYSSSTVSLKSSSPLPSPRPSASFSSPKQPSFQLPKLFVPESYRECGSPDREGYHSIHTIFVHFHDLWLLDSMTSSDDEPEPMGIGATSLGRVAGSRLREPPTEIWRGAVSRDGMAYLTEAVAITMQQ